MDTALQLVLWFYGGVGLFLFSFVTMYGAWINWYEDNYVNYFKYDDYKRLEDTVYSEKVAEPPKLRLVG